MGSVKSERERLKELLLKQREEYFDRNMEEPGTERRTSSQTHRSISDRRSIVAPNRSDFSRRTSGKERRVTKYGRRKSDLLNKPKDK